MPRGSRHTETGLLLEDHGQLSLSVDTGGTWRSDAPRAARKLAGRRVGVFGTRAEVDLLDVKKIEVL